MADRPPSPVLPDYERGCITNVVAACLDPNGDLPGWVPTPLAGADQVVLLVLDGLGWNQLEERRSLAPTLAGLSGGPITTVAPSTTSTALTSITTGTPPGVHGVIGYRLAVDHEVLNILRWSTARGDARKTIEPGSIQFEPPFAGERPPVITRADFESSGFTVAHLAGVRFNGYRTMGTMVAEARRLVRSGEPFVYVYYDGVDKVAHEYGLGDTYDEELVWVDRLVGSLVESLPAGAALVVTADHGQVDVGDAIVELQPPVLAEVVGQSGEGRFRWLHARPGRAEELLAAAESCHGDTGWVVTRQQTIDEQWFGPKVTEAAAGRLGDVALVARDPVAYNDPADTGPYQLIARHGSLTPDEMYVPLLAARA